MSYDINLKHLEYFIKVARLGSINKAAQMLYVSQSHLGKIIHDLEETVGAPLLNRSRQGVTLTPEGNEFLERSVRILKEMEEMHLQGVPRQLISRGSRLPLDLPHHRVAVNCISIASACGQSSSIPLPLLFTPKRVSA